MSENYKIIAENRKARFNYELLETVEAGLILLGSEVKSLRLGKSSIAEAYVGELLGQQKKEALYLLNSTIEPYQKASTFNHESKTPRQLLLKKRQIRKFLGSIRRKGMTVVPLQLYFNHKGLAKLKIALARGKNTVDKRETVKQREWQREKSRTLKNNFH